MERKKIFREKTLTWYEKHGRNFYWRRENLNLFRVLVVEILLRKTKAEKVEEMIEGFFQRFPDPKTLCHSKDEEIKKMIQGLGLQNVRTKTLKQVSKTIHNQDDFAVEDIEEITGVGRYIKNSVECFALDHKVPVVDVNVARVFSRYFDVEVKREIGKDEQIWNFAEKLLPKKNFKNFNWALIDMGAVICKRNPECDICPLEPTCEYVD